MKININDCAGKVLVSDDAGNPIANGLCSIEMYIHGGHGHISHMAGEPQPGIVADLVSRNEGRENAR